MCACHGNNRVCYVSSERYNLAFLGFKCNIPRLTINQHRYQRCFADRDMMLTITHCHCHTKNNKQLDNVCTKTKPSITKLLMRYHENILPCLTPWLAELALHLTEQIRWLYMSSTISWTTSIFLSSNFLNKLLCFWKVGGCCFLNSFADGCITLLVIIYLGLLMSYQYHPSFSQLL